MKRSLMLLAILLSGCQTATKKPYKVVIPRECMEHIDMTQATKCEEQKDGTMLCTNLVLTYHTGCQQLRVTK